jgi:hypothetical protein
MIRNTKVADCRLMQVVAGVTVPVHWLVDSVVIKSVYQKVVVAILTEVNEQGGAVMTNGAPHSV